MNTQHHYNTTYHIWFWLSKDLTSVQTFLPGTLLRPWSHSSCMSNKDCWSLPPYGRFLEATATQCLRPCDILSDIWWLWRCRHQLEVWLILIHSTCQSMWSWECWAFHGNELQHWCCESIDVTPKNRKLWNMDRYLTEYKRYLDPVIMLIDIITRGRYLLLGGCILLGRHTVVPRHWLLCGGEWIERETSEWGKGK